MNKRYWYVAIVGSRRFPRLGEVGLAVGALLRRMENTGYALKIVSGGAWGVDGTATNAAKKLKIPMLEFLPDYDRYGRYRAPKIRNGLIAEHCDCMIAFHDRKSGGTRDAMEWADYYGRPLLYFGPETINCEPEIKAWKALPPFIPTTAKAEHMSGQQRDRQESDRMYGRESKTAEELDREINEFFFT